MQAVVGTRLSCASSPDKHEVFVMEPIEQPPKSWPCQHHSLTGDVLPIFIPPRASLDDKMLNGGVPVANPDDISFAYRFTG